MRNLKKFLALALAMLMVMSAGAAVSAYTDVAEDNQYAAAIAKLTEYGIVNGTDAEADTFSPDAAVTRCQMALMMARALDVSKTNEDWANGMEIFADVNQWYGAIAYAYMNGIVTGMTATEFAPNEGIRYQDALIMALRALGYTVDVSGTPYWLAAWGQAVELGLTENVAVTKGDQALNRAETAQIIYNMINTVPANGGATIAEKNFGVAGVANTTTFVITATKNQAYYSVAKDVIGDGIVGLQQLVAGLPTGDMLYLPVEALPFEEGKDADDYFGWAFDFVNYDAETGNIGNILLGEEPLVVYNADVKDIAANKFSVGGTVYYTADVIAETTYNKNEIILFDGGMTAKKGTFLITNKDGDIIDRNANVLAVYAYTLNGVNYYFDGENKAGELQSVISESAALKKYGVTVEDDTYAEYETLAAQALKDNDNYQVTLFDDDRDGKYERAYVTDVYLSAYLLKDSKPDFGPAAIKNQSGVTFVNAETGETFVPTKGQILKYTVNTQTKVVTVLEIVEAQTGTLTRINTTANNPDNKMKVALDIVDAEGVKTTYYLANSVREAAGITGATLTDITACATTADNAGDCYDHVTEDGKLCYLYDCTVCGWKNVLKVGSPIAFYALDNLELITAKCYKLDETFDLAVLDEIVSYDSEYVYVDMYINGVEIKEAPVSIINKKEIAELSIFQLSRLLGDEELFAEGNVFRAIKNGDAYQLSEYLVPTDATSLNAFKLITKGFDPTVKVLFDDGVADRKSDGTTTSTITADDFIIRTDSTTTIYLIQTTADGTVLHVVKGAAPDGSYIDFSKGAKVYANAIGYGSAENTGVSKNLFVYYTADNACYFGKVAAKTSVVYVAGDPDEVDVKPSYNWEAASAYDLNDEDYVGKYFYKYASSTQAFNMDTGAAVGTLYSEDYLEGGEFYEVDANGVVLKKYDSATAAGVTLDAVKQGDFRQRTTWEITGIAGATFADGIKTVIVANGTKIEPKTNKVSDVIAATDTKVAYKIVDDKFIAVTYEVTAPTQPDNKTYATVNAKWVNAGVTKAANVDTIEAKDGKYTATLTVYDEAFTAYGEKVDVSKKLSFSAEGNGVKYTATTITAPTNVKATASFVVADGTLKVTVSANQEVITDPATLAAGNYVVVIGNGQNQDSYTVAFTVA